MSDATYYRANSTRITFKEYNWGTPFPISGIVWLTKFLGIRLPASTDDPMVHEVAPFEVAELPEEIEGEMSGLWDELERLGFHSPIFHHINIPHCTTNIYWATFQHESGETVARIHYRVWNATKPPQEYLFPMFLTELSDGGFLWSSSGKPDMLAPDEITMNRHKGAKLDTLWESHRELINERSPSEIVPVRDERGLRELTDNHHALVRDFHIRRGVFEPLTVPDWLKRPDLLSSRPQSSAGAAAAASAEVGMALERDPDIIDAEEIEVIEREAALVADGPGAFYENDQGNIGEADEPSPEMLDEHADVLMALDQLQSRRRGWLSGAIILIVSIAFFLGLGAARWEWTFVVMLIPILLFHEFGHWVAMKAFGYRDTRMFFIPLFGAAVSGRHLNAPGWKTAIVALAGPVPGIVAGGVLGMVGLYLDRKWMIDAAMLTIIINGLNLVPIYPFDGGRVVHITLFCRHPLLDVVFRGLAALALLGLGLLAGDKILMFIAIPLLIALPAAYRMATVAEEFAQTEPESFVPTKDHRIPWPTARKVIARLKEKFPANLQPAHLAQYTLSVFETVNARPPGPLASIAFLGVQAGSLVATIVLASLLVVGRHGNLFDFMQMAAQKPKLPLECGSVLHTGDLDEVDGAPDFTAAVMVDCDDPQSAQDVFDRLSAGLPDGSRLTRFGQHIIATVNESDDAARRQWIRQFEEDEGLRVSVARKDLSVFAELMAIAPTAEDAERMEREAAFPLNYSYQFPGLITPWHPEWKAAGADQQAAWMDARQAYQAYFEADQIPYDEQDPRIDRLNRRYERAMRLREDEEMAKISKEILKINNERREQAWQAFLQTAEEHDQDILAAYETLRVKQMEQLEQWEENFDADAPVEYDPRKIDPIYEPMADLLGSLPREAGRVQGPLGRASVGGYFEREALVVHISGISSSDPATLLSDVAEWLCDNNCADITYRIGNPFDDLMFDEGFLD